MTLRALDLFCGAGGASEGLHRAGFEVVGVDIAPQKNYPFRFIQADALTFPLDGYDLIWASPVCKRFSSATRTSKTSAIWPDQIMPLRARLEKWGGAWIIENVLGAPLRNSVMLCGAQFGLKVYRHRYFESSHLLLVPPHLEHHTPIVKMGRRPKPGDFINPVGHFSGVGYAQQAMGIDWMGQKELSQAIPPAYSEFLTRQVIEQLSRAATETT
jgi:DNA (cytosine-5)-methyltransferase 1